MRGCAVASAGGCAQLPAGREQPQVDRTRHHRIPSVTRVQVVPGIVLRAELGRLRRIAQGRVQVDHCVVVGTGIPAAQLDSVALAAIPAPAHATPTSAPCTSRDMWKTYVSR